MYCIYIYIILYYIVLYYMILYYIILYLYLAVGIRRKKRKKLELYSGWDRSPTGGCWENLSEMIMAM